MTFLTQLFECSGCGALLERDEDSGALLACSECGSTSSRPIIDIKEEVIFKVKQSGATGDPALKIKIADEFYQEKSEWRQIKMSINKNDDNYEKTVINPKTDEVLYHNSEPLSRHTGRGSAKRKHEKKKR
jgi:DNA-directed RNA polymerase subunit M/transcription elongation factor TFIIS